MASYIYYDISIGIVLCIIPKPEKSIFCRVLSCLVVSCRVVLWLWLSSTQRKWN